MDSSSLNWLRFSLSNTNYHLPSGSNQLCLLQPFNNITPCGVIDRAGQQDATNTDSSLLIAGSGPKLEDFLGGCALGQFTGETPTSVSDNTDDVYDYELKTIAGSFLHGVSNEQTDNTTQKQLVQLAEPVPKKAGDSSFGHRTSIYRGVTRHRWTGRYEAHLWDNSCRREGQSRKGRQVYLGGYDKEKKAAIAYDLAALKYWGPTTTTNFPISNYEKELEEMKNMNKQEFVASLRRKSSGFSRGASIYRGVTRHHQHGRWQARIGRVAGNKDLYLGTFSTQEEAAEAYDIAAIKFRGLNAVTNFDMNRYDVKSIANNNLPIGGIAGKSKISSPDQTVSVTKCSTNGIPSDDPDLASPIPWQNPATTSNLSLALPYSIIGYHPNQQSVAPSSLQSSNNGFDHGFQNAAAPILTPFDMAICTSSTVNNQVSNGFFNGGFIQQYHNKSNGASSSSTLPLDTHIALNSSNSNDDYSGYSSWAAPSPHLMQTSKPNLSVFHTPIFGME